MTKFFCLAASLLATLSPAFGASVELDIKSASDYGNSVVNFPASNAIDGSTSWSSRWVAETIDGAVNLVLDLGSDKTVDEVAVAWGKGDDYSHRFEIRVMPDGGSWSQVYKGSSSGASESYEFYNVDDMTARYVRIKIHDNSAGTDSQMIKEVKILGSSSSSGSSPISSSSSSSSDEGPAPTKSPVTSPTKSPVTSPTKSPVTSPTKSPVAPSSPSGGGDYGLNPDKTPGDNFDLLGWKLTTPAEDPDDGWAFEASEDDLDSGYTDEYFYTGPDGAMVFRCTSDGTKTSEKTKYVRAELREMLRYGNTKIGTHDKGNNWAFSSISSGSQSSFGGIDGLLSATLKVEHVTVTGKSDLKNGRIIIGQIHAEDNEPARLYYHKTPENKNGAIYLAHEPADSSGEEESWYNILGSMVKSEGGISTTSNPSNGIPLGEVFSYTIKVDGDMLYVKVYDADGTELGAADVNMSKSDYDKSDNYMYYKAGIYLNDDTADSDDYAEVSFYSLTHTHD